MMDTGRPSSCSVSEVLGLDLVGAEVTEAGVTTFAVVEHFEVEVKTPLRFFVGAEVAIQSIGNRMSLPVAKRM